MQKRFLIDDRKIQCQKSGNLWVFLRCLLISTGLIFSFSSFSRSDTCFKVLQANYGGDAEDIAYDIVDAGAGQFYLVGNTKSFGAGGYDILVIKMDAAKNILWSNTYGVSGNETIRKASPSPDGGLLITGQTNSFANSRGDILAMKVNIDGSLKWARTFGAGSSNGDLGSDIIQTGDGGFAISGILDVAGFVADGVVIRLDANANQVWAKRFMSDIGEDGSGIVESGNTLVATFDIEKRVGLNYGMNISVLQTFDGQFISSKLYVSNTKGLFRPMIYKDNSNGYWINAHLIEASDYNQMEQVILRMNSSFNITASYKLQKSPLTNNYYTGFVPLKNGGFITCASEPLNAGGKGHIYKIAADGKIVFAKSIKTSGKASLNALIVSGDRILTAGSDNHSGSQDFYLADFDSTGNNSNLCSVDTSIVTVQTHPFTISDFAWSSVSAQAFSNTVRSLTTAAQNVKNVAFCSVNNSTPIDFSYQQDLCNPLQVRFFGSDTTHQLSWSFGDGSPVSTIKNPSHLFPNFGSYDIELTGGQECPSTSVKKVILNIVQADVIKNKDTVICDNGSVQMQADPGAEYCWKPATYLSNPSIQNPIATPTQNITYHLISKSIGSNIIVNGDFTAGNSGFSSGYHFANSNITEGEYFVGTNPQAWNAALSTCKDHTSGNGNMLLVNGSPVADVKVWTQTIAVTPNTIYEFSTWIQALYPPNPAKLQFSINGSILGNVITAHLPTCTWTRFNTNWNSGLATTATISIVNKNTEIQGNDFALDDISFAPFTFKNDSVKVTIEKPVIKTSNDTTICLGESVQLNTIGAQTYSWQPPAGLSNTSIANPIAKPSATTAFIVTGKTASGCTAKDTVLIMVNSQSAGPKDFSYQQDICNPLSIQFISSANNIAFWDFGDGSPVVQQQAPFHLYKNSGVYVVKMWLSPSICQAGDTLTKSIAVAIVKENIIVSKDTTICKDGFVQMRTDPAVEYCWSPSLYLNNSSIRNPVAKPLQNITYFLTSKVVGTNLVVNGDFSSGNSAFTSDYDYADIGAAAGRYLVDKSPASYWPNAPVCTDHTTGTGNMMLVNGASTPGVKVWTQTINISPNRVYEFSCWVENISRVQFNLCKLQFSINGSPLSFPFRSDSTACVWKRFFANWSSGNVTTATISIVNQSTDFDGNDFALDDISFAPISIKQDSIKITIDKPFVKTGSDTVVCPGSTVQLNASGAVSYIWFPATGLSNAGIQNPVATAAVKTNYVVTGTNSNGCTAKDTVVVSMLPSPGISISPDTTICDKGQAQLNSSGGISYKWTPTTSLSNPLVANPVAFPSVSTQYKVTVTGANGCTAIDSVLVKLAQSPRIAISNDTSLCPGSSAQLFASGGASYTWLPASGLTNPNINNPKASPVNDTKYIVQVKNADGCISSDSLVVSLLPNPVITVSNDTSICREGKAALLATGAYSYVWSPSVGLSSNSVSNPFAQPFSNTIYTVTGTATNGCKASAAVKVSIYPVPVIHLTNDTAICSNSSLTLQASGGTSYVWSPSTGLDNPFNSNPITSPLVDTKYTVQITDSHGCSNQDSVLVSIRHPAQFGVKSSGFTVCLGESVQLEAYGGDKYSWAPPTGLSDPNIADPILKSQITKTYVVTVKESVCNTQADFPVVITVVPSIPIVVTKSNDITCNTPIAVLNAGASGIKYSWSPVTGLSDPTIANPSASPTATTSYKVVVINAAGCVSNGAIDVKVINNADFRLYQVPNAFTPNGDGNNDCFGVGKWGTVSVVYFEIYNRWGQLVFDGSNSRQCWEGSFKGISQPSGNYVYKMKVQTMCGEVERKGNVVLIR